MGGITKTLFGGSSSKQKSEQSSTSENQAYPTLLGALSPNIGQGNSAMSTLGGLLGIGDPSASQGTLKNFLDSTGFNFLKTQGENAITGGAAAGGLLRSGGTGKAIASFGQNLASTKLNELMQNLTSLGNYGTQSAQVIAQAGQKSTSTGTSSGSGGSQSGVFNALFPGGLSDPRLKTKLRYLGTNEQDIDVYEFEFHALPGMVHIGVLASDVAEKLPDAQGWYGTLMTVDYSAIKPLADHPFTAPISMEDLHNG
jgi:hypothetical protein